MILGVAAVFVVQMGLNIFGSCNLIPFTGVTIPFISQGGTSMITCGLLAGMLKAGQSPTFRKPNVVSENTLSFKLPFRKEKEADELLSKHAPAPNANKPQAPQRSTTRTPQQPASQNRTTPMQGGAPRQQARPTQPNPYGQPLNQTRTIPTNGTPRQQARPTQPNPYGQPVNRTAPPNRSNNPYARPNTIQHSGSSQNEQTRMYRNNSEQGGSHNEKY